MKKKNIIIAGLSVSLGLLTVEYIRLASDFQTLLLKRLEDEKTVKAAEEIFFAYKFDQIAEHFEE